MLVVTESATSEARIGDSLESALPEHSVVVEYSAAQVAQGGVAGCLSDTLSEAAVGQRAGVLVRQLQLLGRTEAERLVVVQLPRLECADWVMLTLVAPESTVEGRRLLALIEKRWQPDCVIHVRDTP
jgi:hypothetical protein